MDSSERADLSKQFADYARKNALTRENMVAKNRQIAELESHNAHLAVDNDGLRRWRASIEKSITEAGDVAQGYIEGTERAMQAYWRDYYRAKERMAALETALAKAADMLEIYAVKVDCEWGDCRDAGQLYADGEMPEALTEARALLTQEEGG